MPATQSPTDRILSPAPKKSPVGVFVIGLITGMVGLAIVYGSLPGTDVLTQFMKSPVRPYAAYRVALEESQVAETLLGKAWIEAGTEALTDSTYLLPPHLESGYISPQQQQVISYRIQPRKGQLLSVRLDLTSVVDSPQIFIELFEGDPSGVHPAQPVAYADSGSYQLEYEVEADEVYLLRIQPELLARFSYRLQVVLGASLVFPVSGKDSKAIRSFWGDSRDGGRRKHKGVDIFATKGTPVLAAVNGRISRVRNGGLGGKVVWQRDVNQRYSLYYAHLDTQWVRRGQQVEVGDTLGLVGNTGNARTTPPHLHFGIYQRRGGAVDPFPFVDQPSIIPPPLIAADSGMLNTYTIKRPGKLLSAPSATADIIREVPADTPVRRLAASGEWHRVQLPDGTEGFVLHTHSQSSHLALGTITLTQNQFLFDQVLEGIHSDSLPAGSKVDLLAQTASHQYIRTADGRLGYLARSLDAIPQTQ